MLLTEAAACRHLDEKPAVELIRRKPKWPQARATQAGISAAGTSARWFSPWLVVDLRLGVRGVEVLCVRNAYFGGSLLARFLLVVRNNGISPLVSEDPSRAEGPGSGGVSLGSYAI